MRKKLVLLMLLASLLSLALAGCSGGSASSNQIKINTLDTSGSGQAQTTPNPSQPAPIASSTGEQLAVGTLKLEGTSNAVTADQAKVLHPLWQQEKTLSADSSATSDQIQAVYDQILKLMTAEQTNLLML